MQEGITDFSQLTVATYYLIDGTWVVYIDSIDRKQKEAWAMAWTGDKDDVEYYEDEQGTPYPMFRCNEWVEREHPVPITATQAKTLIEMWK